MASKPRRSSPSRPATTAASPPAQDNPLPHGVDVQRMIAQLRANDPATVRDAYRRTFGTPLGHMVLAHFVAGCGVGAPQGPGVSADDRHYAAGRHDAGLDLMSAAGFDQASAVLAVLTDTPPEGYTDEQGGSGYGRHDDDDDLGD